MKINLIHALIIADAFLASVTIFSLRLEFAISVLFVLGFLAIFARDYSRPSEPFTSEAISPQVKPTPTERLPLAS